MYDLFLSFPLVQKILQWRHTGFNVHSQVKAQTKSEAERVGKYMIRPVLSLKRLFFDETGGKVRYQHSRHGSQEESMNYLEFIARVTSHIPDKGQVMVRYYGLYSNAHRGKMRKAGADPAHPSIIEDDSSYVPSKGWAEMIKKVYELDPLECPSCGGQMKIISFIEEPKTSTGSSVTPAQPSPIDLPGRTPPSASSSPAGTPDGSRGERGIFLRAPVAAFADSKEEFILNLLGCRFWLNCAAFRVVDLVVIDVILLF